jgi:transcriptional regulator with XRE-family HTH domain
MARGVFMKRHPIDIHVGTRLKTLRLQRGWSQTALAERVDLTFQQIQKYENGSNRISPILSAIPEIRRTVWC